MTRASAINNQQQQQQQREPDDGETQLIDNVIVILAFSSQIRFKQHFAIVIFANSFQATLCNCYPRISSHRRFHTAQHRILVIALHCTYQSLGLFNEPF